MGTFGAVIRIKSPIPHRKALFDIGIAGPLAGFVVCIPVLILGVLEGRWVPLTNGGEGPGYFGEPLLFQWAVHLLRGPAPDGMTLAIGPLGLAAWFGLFVTALNMMPVGQLDGGHVTFSLLPRYAHDVSRAGLLVCLGLLYFRPVWLLWTILLWALGRRPHPPTLYNAVPIGRGRLLVGLLGFAILAVCFTPDPILIVVARHLRQLSRPHITLTGSTSTLIPGQRIGAVAFDQDPAHGLAHRRSPPLEQDLEAVLLPHPRQRGAEPAPARGTDPGRAAGGARASASASWRPFRGVPDRTTTFSSAPAGG